jgi:hypothetical protein
VWCVADSAGDSTFLGTVVPEGSGVSRHVPQDIPLSACHFTTQKDAGELMECDTTFAAGPCPVAGPHWLN